MHDLHVWSLTSGVNAMSAHVVVNESLTNNEMLDIINNAITSKFKISHTTFQLEAKDYKESEVHL